MKGTGIHTTIKFNKYFLTLGERGNLIRAGRTKLEIYQDI